ncbi:MAG: AAA family ATPase, partial [Dehalococcoidia bacterium]
MLVELYIKNLAVIEELRVEFNEGLTILSGEEGAGKSLLVDALCLLTGGRANAALVRSGEPAAVIEGVFWLSPDDSRLMESLKETGVELDGDGSVILFREIREHGRSIARVNGRAVPVSLLQELGQLLVDVHSQRDHISLLNPQRQLDLLDSYGGLLASRSLLGRKVRELRDTARELSALTDRSSGRRRELLEYQVAEIDGAEIDPDEYEALEQEGHV